jgi:hypothetical protein
MRYSFLTVTTLLSLNRPPAEGPHGGIVKSAEGYYIEMKNNPDTSFFAYLLDKKQMTISNKGVSGQVKFFFSDNTAMDVQLKPAAENSFTARITPGFYACKITFHVLGKDVSALFEKQNQIAEQK